MILAGIGIIAYLLIAVAMHDLFSAAGRTPTAFLVSLLWLPILLVLGLIRLVEKL